MKKQWVTIAVSGLALGASLIGVGVSADEQAANQVTSASTPESVSQNSDFVVTETTVDTVSYTHLDVYKRQGNGWPKMTSRFKA